MTLGRPVLVAPKHRLSTEIMSRDAERSNKISLTRVQLPSTTYQSVTSQRKTGLNDFGNRWCKRESVECNAMKEWKLSIFNIVDKRIKFYSQNTNLLPPKPKSSFRHLKQGIQEFHGKYVLVPADKAANNVVVVCRLHYINTLKQELNGTKAYEETSKDEKFVVYSHLNEIPNKFAVDVKERQDRLPTMYWLPKLHKRPYKARFIANSSSCTTTELSKLLTSCLTAIKAKVIKYCETVYERSGKNMFWPIKNSGEVLSKLKDIGYQATSLSTYDFSTLYTILPHNLIKENFLTWLSGPSIKRKVSYTLLVMIRKRFSLRKTIIKDINFGLVRMYVTPYRFSWTIFILGLALSYTDKLLVFRWVQIVLHLKVICFYSAMKEISWEIFLVITRLMLLRRSTQRLDI